MSQAASQRRVGTNLTTGPIMKSLLLFAFPIVLTNLVQQLYSMVDLIVIGQYVGSVGTVGVNTGGEMADLVSPVAMGFATAGQIFIAQLVGAGDDRRIKRTVGTLLSFTTLLAVLLAAAAILFCRPILQLLNCPQEALFEAESYMIITALGYPFIFGYNAICGVLRGMGESKRPLIFILIAAAINIVLDIVLVAVFRLDAAGTAIATALSQMGSCVAAFIFLWKRREHFDFELKPSYFRMDKEILAVLIRLGIPQVVRSMFVRIGMLWVNANANSFGLVVSATNSVGNKLQKFLEVFVQGIDTASASMVGQNLGAKKIERLKQGYHAALVLDACFAALAFLVIETLHTQISALFLGKDGTALAYQVSGDYMRWLGFFFIFMGIKMATDGVLRGLGIMRPFLAANMVNLAIRLSVALICAPRFGIAFVWLAVPAGWLANFLISYAALRRSWPAEKAVSFR